MTKYIVSSDINIVVDSGWEESEYFGEYTVLEKKSEHYVSAIVIFNTEEEAKKSWSEYLNQDGNLSIKKIEI
jgi:hypothetical protein